MPEAFPAGTVFHGEDELKSHMFRCGGWLVVAGFFVAAAQAATLADDARIKSLLSQRITAERSAGMAAGVIDDSGERFVVAGVREKGQAVTVDADTVFEIGSISKTFTGVLLAQMVQDGTLKLDTRVSELLPLGVKLPASLDNPQRPLTLRDLATQTSGLPRQDPLFKIGNPANPYAAYTADDLWKGLSAAPSGAVPGASYEYSNLGFMLLSQLLVQASGKASYEDLVRERILAPLGMRSCGVSTGSANAAHPHDTALKPVPAWDFAPTMGGVGALRCSARDLLRFAAANLRAAEGSAYALTHLPQWEKDGRRMGLAWHTRKTKSGNLLFWHNGGTGGSRAFIGFDPAGKTAVVVLSNSADDVTALGMHLLDPESPLPEVKKLAEVDAATLQSLIGEYAAEGSSQPGLYVMRGPGPGARIMARVGAGGPQLMEAESETRFTSTSGRLTLEFEPVAKGAASVVKVTQGPNGEAATFRRIAEKPTITLTAAQLQPLLGTYRLASQQFVISVEGDNLMLTIGGNRPFKLVAESPTEFVMRALGARVRFTRNGDGPASELAWTQLGSTAVATRQEP